MSRPMRGTHAPEVIEQGPGSLAYPAGSVADFANRTPTEVAAQLLRVAEYLARVAADVATVQSAPVTVATDVQRTAWGPVEVADSMGLHPDTVRRLLQSGEMRGFKINGRWVISEDARREFVAKKEREAAEELGLAS